MAESPTECPRTDVRKVLQPFASIEQSSSMGKGYLSNLRHHEPAPPGSAHVPFSRFLGVALGSAQPAFGSFTDSFFLLFSALSQGIPGRSLKHIFGNKTQ